MHTPAANEALTPIPDTQRVFRWHDHASLWFSLGVACWSCRWAPT